MEESKMACIDHLNLHILIMLVLAENWRPYINFLEAQLVEIVSCHKTSVQAVDRCHALQDERTMYSKVGETRISDYPLTFRDAQDLELFRRKMTKASLILKSNADVARFWSLEVERVCQSLGEDSIQDGQRAMRQHINELERHVMVLDLLLENLAGTSRLVRN